MIKKRRTPKLFFAGREVANSEGLHATQSKNYSFIWMMVKLYLNLLYSLFYVHYKYGSYVIFCDSFLSLHSVILDAGTNLSTSTFF